MPRSVPSTSPSGLPMINSERDVEVGEECDVHARAESDHKRKTPHVSRVAVRRFFKHLPVDAG
jgi:hypothetical protein